MSFPPEHWLYTETENGARWTDPEGPHNPITYTVTIDAPPVVVPHKAPAPRKLNRAQRRAKAKR